MKHILPYAYQHVYERAKDLGIIFYSNIDRLIYYTIASIMTRKRNIKVAAASIMYSHTHKTMIAENYSCLEQCENDILSTFARAYNYHYNTRGQLFDRKFGHAQKNKEKAIRQNLAYVYNNHVEKGLCKTAMENRWSLLAYATSDHPFSNAIDTKAASRQLRRFLGVVKRHSDNNKYLTYKCLTNMIKSLCKEEQEQLIDYIVSTYRLIDFSLAICQFSSMDAMINVLDNSTGSEYDIKETYTKESDLAFCQMIHILNKTQLLGKVYNLTNEDRERLVDYFHVYTDASDYQISALLHLNRTS